MREINQRDRLLSHARKLEHERNMLKAAGYVLQEAVIRLLEINDCNGATNGELEEAAALGYAPEIIQEAETVLLARKALGMTNYLFPENDEAEARR